MTIILESFEIESPEYGKALTIDLVEGLDSVHIDFIEKQWGQILARRRDLALLGFFSLPLASRTNAEWNEKQRIFGAPDAHWDWRNKCAIAPNSNRKIFALLNADEVEAVMLLSFGKTSRDAENALPIVYIDYLAVAPWNRATIQNPLRFRKLGTVMLGAAVGISISMGLEGRCGLHSIPQAEGFYQLIGMNDFDIDPAYSSLRYFEFSAQAAKQFIEKGDL